MTYINPRNKLLQHIDRIASIKAGGNPPPVNVEIDLSNRCDLGCEFCHFAYTHTRGPHAHSEKLNDAIPGGDLMDTHLAVDIIDQLYNFGVRSITWTGGGEPTLHPDFEQIISLNYVYGMDQGIYTNLAHTSRDNMLAMKDSMKWILVSLDADYRGEYKRLKRVDAFDEVCEHINLIANYPGNATIGVSFLLNKHNFERTESMIRLGLSLGADYVQLRPTISFDLQNPGNVGEDTSWALEAAAYLADLAWNPRVEIDLDRFIAYGNWIRHGYQTCWWSRMQTVITPNGKVWGCVNKREFPDAELGDLTNELFADIWKRAPTQMVNNQCRVFCRGHIPNQALDIMMAEQIHGNFV